MFFRERFRGMWIFADDEDHGPTCRRSVLLQILASRRMACHGDTSLSAIDDSD